MGAARLAGWVGLMAGWLAGSGMGGGSQGERLQRCAAGAQAALRECALHPTSPSAPSLPPLTPTGAGEPGPPGEVLRGHAASLPNQAGGTKGARQAAGQERRGQRREGGGRVGAGSAGQYIGGQLGQEQRPTRGSPHQKRISSVANAARSRLLAAAQYVSPSCSLHDHATLLPDALMSTGAPQVLPRPPEEQPAVVAPPRGRVAAGRHAAGAGPSLGSRCPPACKACGVAVLCCGAA